MYDTWYALGYAISTSSIGTPGLLKTITDITDATPAFVKLKARIFTEVKADGSSYVIVNNRTAGLLDMNVTANVRKTIHGALPAGSPPVSYYTAGKFCQFLTIGLIDSANKRGFKEIIYLANGVYAAQVGGAAVSSGFLALVGLSLIDTTARGVLAGSVAPKPDLLSEFGVSNAQEITMITNISKDATFQAAQASLITGDGNTWDPNEGCSEQFFSWDGGNAKSTRAVY
jgi:hypothetical protein